MGAGASARRPVECTAEAFDNLPVLSVRDLLESDVPDGTRVQVVGHAEALDDAEPFETPFLQTRCLAAELTGSMALWKPYNIFELGVTRAAGSERPATAYQPWRNVLRANRGRDFAIHDPPTTVLVEAPDNRCSQLFTHEGPSLRVVLPSAVSEWGKKGERSPGSGERRRHCSLFLGHKTSEDNLRFDPRHGVLLGSTWEMPAWGDWEHKEPLPRLLSVGTVAPHGHAFWNAHTSMPWHAKVITLIG